MEDNKLPDKNARRNTDNVPEGNGGSDELSLSREEKLRKEIDALKEHIKSKDAMIRKKNDEIQVKNKQLKQKDEQIIKHEKRIDELEREVKDALKNTEQLHELNKLFAGDASDHQKLDYAKRILDSLPNWIKDNLKSIIGGFMTLCGRDWRVIVLTALGVIGGGIALAYVGGVAGALAGATYAESATASCITASGAAKGAVVGAVVGSIAGGYRGYENAKMEEVPPKDS